MKKQKSFFSDSSQMNKDGVLLTEELDSFLEEVYNNYIDKRFNLREITQLVISSVTLIESKKAVEFSEKYNKEKRNSIAKARLENDKSFFDEEDVKSSYK